MKIEYQPIGLIRTPFEETSGMPSNPAAAAAAAGRVEVENAYAAGLKDVEGFSHLVLLFHFDRSSDYSLRLVPRGQTGERGVFATRAPRRPNAVGMSVVRLERIDGNVLHVRGVDMLDGTPLLDIKPYLRSIDAHPEATMGWREPERTSEGGPEAG